MRSLLGEGGVSNGICCIQHREPLTPVLLHAWTPTISSDASCWSWWWPPSSGSSPANSGTQGTHTHTRTGEMNTAYCAANCHSIFCFFITYPSAYTGLKPRSSRHDRTRCTVRRFARSPVRHARRARCGEKYAKTLSRRGLGTSLAARDSTLQQKQTCNMQVLDSLGPLGVDRVGCTPFL